MTLFQFEFQDESGNWVEFGTAKGSGRSHLGDALTDLQDEGQVRLTPGRYRYRPLDGETETWQIFSVDERRRVRKLDV